MSAEDLELVIALSEKTGALSSSSTPIGPGRLWHKKDPSVHLPNYIRNVAKALIRNGHDESSAIAIAVGTVKHWASGGGKVTPEVRAAASKAVAEWEALKTHSHETK